MSDSLYIYEWLRPRKMVFAVEGGSRCSLEKRSLRSPVSPERVVRSNRARIDGQYQCALRAYYNFVKNSVLT